MWSRDIPDGEFKFLKKSTKVIWESCPTSILYFKKGELDEEEIFHPFPNATDHKYLLEE